MGQGINMLFIALRWLVKLSIMKLLENVLVPTPYYVFIDMYLFKIINIL